MNYDFSHTPCRRGTNSYKWDSAPDMLPLWVADMDFECPPCVRTAVERRAAHGVYGYTLVPEGFYQSVIDWFGTRHGLALTREHIIYTSGVIPGLSACIKALAPRGSQIVVLTPVFNCFFSSIRNNGCRIVEVPLLYSERTYRIDYAALEAALASPDCHTMIMCNPHNPAGRVWTEGELRRVADLCLKHHVTVLSDEIHCELTFSGYRYTPFASLGADVAAITVSLLSPSKSFNFAGLQIAVVVAPSAETLARIDRAINDNEVCDVNPFGVEALMAAYSPAGEEWLTQLMAYIETNYRTLLSELADAAPQVEVARLEGTYLAWLDMRALGLSSETMEEELKSEQALWLSAGTHYGEAGEGFLRLNLATTREMVTEAARRLARYVAQKVNEA